ncbi:MAG: metallophosphoesterase family protein [Prolixibacteraceae bacterium]
MKKVIAFLAALMMMMSAWAGVDQSNKELRFNANGKFKIVQFTDIHFQYDSFRSDSALVLMKTVIEKEKPDLVVLTGDVVCSKNTVKAWLALAQVLINAKVPWAVSLGNHDIEYELNGKQIMETIENLPYNLTANGPENLSGNGNYVLKIQSSKSNNTAALLYFLDSHSGFKPKGDLGSYEWVTPAQINWYREQSRAFTMQNGGKPYPALAFFHIPLPEYKEIIGKKTTVGIQEETVCSPDLNSGLYTVMLESKDVMGIFVGHDHNNNYIGVLHNICLAYGNVTGRQCYGKIGRGARVVELYENTRRFDTWVLKLYECDRDKDIWTRTGDYERKFFVTYPDSFEEKK